MGEMRQNSGKAPAYQMYPRDWNEHPRLKHCSYGAQGLWIRLCNASFFYEKPGVFAIGNRALREEEIIDSMPGKPREKRRLFAELKAARIIKQTADGTFYVRRIKEDMELRAVRKAAGKKGGNPNLVGGMVGNLVNQNPNQTGKQTPTPSSSSSFSLNNQEHKHKLTTCASYRREGGVLVWFAVGETEIELTAELVEQDGRMMAVLRERLRPMNGTVKVLEDIAADVMRTYLFEGDEGIFEEAVLTARRIVDDETVKNAEGAFVAWAKKRVGYAARGGTL
jgi:hypothetical protein